MKLLWLAPVRCLTKRPETGIMNYWNAWNYLQVFLVNSGSQVTWLVPLLVRLRENSKCSNLPVYTVGSHDTASAVAGVPASGKEDFAYLSSGTWSLMGVESERPLCDSQSQRLGFTNEFGIEGSIRYLKNISGLWIVQECRRHWQSMGENFDYDQLTHMAKEAKPFVAVIDVDDPIFSSMGEMPDKISQKNAMVLDRLLRVVKIRPFGSL